MEHAFFLKSESEEDDDGTIATGQSVDYDECIDYDTLSDLAGESATKNLSDEQFIAKSVLAEEVCWSVFFVYL